MINGLKLIYQGKHGWRERYKGVVTKIGKKDARIRDGVVGCKILDKLLVVSHWFKY